MSHYDLKHVQLPVLSGRGVALFALLLRTPLVGRLIIRKLIRDAGIPRLFTAGVLDEPTFRPFERGARSRFLMVEPQSTSAQEEEESRPASFRSTAGGVEQEHRARPDRAPTAADFVRSYQEGSTTPAQVAENLLAALEEDKGASLPLLALNAVLPSDLRRQAQESTERYLAGKTLGPLDGVPVVIKDEIDMLPYPTTVGTSFLGGQPPKEDATTVARLRAAGALLVGKGNMYEIGISPESYNKHFGTVRNPHAREHQVGGSSSGPAAAVAAGYCPIALGADGGGSVRIPASFCGLVGLKPTYGRVSEFGAAPLCWSMAHLGPMATSVEDVALAYSTIAGPDPKDENSLKQPPQSPLAWRQGHLEGLRLGVDRNWFEDASPEIVETNDALLEKFRARGAKIVEIEVPDLDLMRVAQAVLILTEMSTAMQPYDDKIHLHAPAVQVNLLAARTLTARHYIRAAQVRTRALEIFARLFSKVDAIVTPTSAITAPRIRKPLPLQGWSDLSTVTEIMRFVFPGNLTGLPAISFPAGSDSEGLPIGMQVMAPHYCEELLFRIAYQAEELVTPLQAKGRARLLGERSEGLA